MNVQRLPKAIDFRSNERRTGFIPPTTKGQWNVNHPLSCRGGRNRKTAAAIAARHGGENVRGWRADKKPRTLEVEPCEHPPPVRGTRLHHSLRCLLPPPPPPPPRTHPEANTSTLHRRTYWLVMGESNTPLDLNPYAVSVRFSKWFEPLQNTFERIQIFEYSWCILIQDTLSTPPSDHPPTPLGKRYTTIHYCAV